jgi:DNA-binding NtrC family response regulator
MATRILVVESSKDVRSVVGEILRAFGWETVETQSASQALEALAQDDSGIAGVVSDVDIDDRAGSQLASELRRMAGVPVLLLGDDRSSPEALPSGVAYLRKPFTVQRLVDAVRQSMPTLAPNPT